MNNQIDRDQWLEDKNFTILIQKNDWLIGDVTKSDTLDYPLVSHWCGGQWNYVFSSPYATKAFRGSVLYLCNVCRKKAPDLIATVHTLYTL